MRTAKEILIENIRTLRFERGWSQMKLAEEASLSTGMIGDIETAKKTPSLESIDKIAKAFNVPVFRLFKDMNESADLERIQSSKEKIDKVIELLKSLDIS